MPAPYKLNIIFDGIVVVGPAHPLEEPFSNQGPLFAMMPRGVRQQTRKSKLDGGKKTYVSVHQPVILTKACPTPASRPPDEIYPADKKCPVFDPSAGPSEHWHLWYPMRERLELYLDGNPTPGPLTYERSGTYNPNAPCGPPISRTDPLIDIAAVSDMREIWPERSKVRKEMLQKQAPVAGELAAQVFVPRGHVRGGTDYPDKPTYESPRIYGIPTTYKPKRTAYEVKKCALSQVVVEVKVTTVGIALYSLDTGERLDGLSFLLQDETEIRIGNADPADIRAALEGTRADARRDLTADTEDLDFEIHYKILDGPDDGGGLPIPFLPPPFMLRPCYTVLVDGND